MTKEMWPLTIDAKSPTDPVFVGVGELPSGRYPERGFIMGLTQVALSPLKDARMVPSDVDTILLIPNLHSFTEEILPRSGGQRPQSGRTSSRGEVRRTSNWRRSTRCLARSS